MASKTIIAVFEDFNDRHEAPSVPLSEPEICESAPGRDESWTDGYLAGRRGRDPDSDRPDMAATLLTSVFALDEKASAAVAAASLLVAELLVTTIIAAVADAVVADEWPVQLIDRVRAVADRIKPALIVAPEFIVRNEHGDPRCFSDISKLSRALEGSKDSDHVSIQWQRGEAIISRSDLLEDLRQAIVPLSSGLSKEQFFRTQT